MTRSTNNNTRAFTILELVTALAMSSIVALAAFALVGVLGHADGVTSRSINNATRMAITHHAVASAMQRLVAATPIQEEVDPNEEAIDGEADESESPPDTQRTQAAGLSDDLPLVAAVADTSQPPFFELQYVRTEQGTVPRLEIVCETPPVGRMQTQIPTSDQRLAMLRAEWLGSVRGRFELLPTETAGWALYWSPVDPPGESTELIGDLTQCSWEVLPREGNGWQQVYAAYLQPDFPVAVRLQLTTSDGAEADWLFETAIITEGR
ncbi:MAG: hypothetical protein KDA20_04075 [Phycisphaerales bacterium]|nr:hypothetical protein [Phycisphaerales bacterium]